METKRVQLDLSESEHAEMERLAEYAGIKTKREFVSNALTLFRWASNELLYGRSISSVDATGKVVKQLEMPCLTAFAQAGEQLNARLVERLQAGTADTRPATPRPAREVIAELRQRLEELTDAQDRQHSLSGAGAPS